MTYLYLLIVRFIDNTISTAKNITLYKGLYFVSSLLEGVSAVLFIFIVTSINTSNQVYTAIVLSVGAILGRYITCKISDKISKDRLYVHVVTTSTEHKIEITKLFYKCIEEDIKVSLYDARDLQMNPTLELHIYSKTKEHSRMVDKFIKDSDTGFFRIVIEG